MCGGTLLGEGLRWGVLIALQVIKVAGRNQLPSLVTSSTISVPDIVNLVELFVDLGVGCAVNIDCPSVGCLAGIDVWLGDVTVLLILKCNPRARGGLKSGKASCLIVGSLSVLAQV